MFKRIINITVIIRFFLVLFLLAHGILSAQEKEGSDVPEKLIRALAKSLLRFDTQTQKQDSTLLTSDNFLNLPPLEDCIDSAIVNHPIIKNSDKSISIRDREVSSVRRSWQKYLFIESSYRYGNTFNFIQYEDNPNNSTISSQDQIYYYTGGYVSFPIEELLNRRNKIKIAEEQKEQAVLDKEIAIKNIRVQVISLYNDILLNQQIVTAANRNQEELAQQILYAEMDFEQHNITVEEYSRVKDMYTKARIEFEQARFALNRSYLLLQELVGFNF